jgi:type II secretory pathway pseudopilin PulG
MNPASTRSARPAFTLVEMLVAMLLMAIVVGVGSLALVAGLRLQQSALDGSQRQSWQSLLADEFRSDVGQAAALADQLEWPAAPPEPLSSLRAGPATLILRIGDKKHVVYRWRQGQLERSEVEGGKRRDRQIPIAFTCKEAEFTRTGSDWPLITLRLTEAPRPGQQARVMEIRAALGGDWR